MRVIAVANQKGGCGKTTTSINFSACLNFLQKKVLLIDLDPQGHSTCGLGVKIPNGGLTLYDLLSPMQKLPPRFSDVVQNIHPRFDILPSNSALNALEEDLSFMPNNHLKLKGLIEKIREKSSTSYDYVVLDCPPNLGVLTWNAFHAVDEVIIPVEPSFFSLHGLAKISETLERVGHSRNTRPVIHALLTIFNSEMNFSQEIYEEVRAHFQNKLFTTIIHEHIHLKESVAAGKSIAQYAPESPAFRDYLNLAVEYLERDWNRKLPENDLGWEKVYENHLGPRRVSDGVLFQFLSKSAESVEIAGDFNHWIPELLVKRTVEGLWQKIMPVELKNFRYKFIVDGEWQVDPNQPERKQNAYGGVDSYAELV